MRYAVTCECPWSGDSENEGAEGFRTEVVEAAGADEALRLAPERLAAYYNEEEGAEYAAEDFAPVACVHASEGGDIEVDL
jgi:hypothetical protein